MSVRARGTETPAYIVGIGGSAGSLKPLEDVLRGLAGCKSIAVIVVTHRHPSTKGMAGILARATRLAVHDAKDGTQLVGGVVYVAPADNDLVLRKGKLELTPRARDDRTRTPIDELFRTIADDCEERAVGIILSGMGEDGAAGLARIKERFGICAVQAPSSAEFLSMPAAALAAGLGDIIGTPEQLGTRIAALVQTPPRSAGEAPKWSHGVGEVLALIRARTGHDFRQYKKNTVVRRIERRMGLCGVRTMPAYAARVERDSAEVDLLLADLLIGVTSFFRDPEAFVALGEAIARRLRVRKSEGPLRAWVAGCASGEEAYSLAMIIHERWEEAHGALPNARLDVQIYATDLDATAIERGRKGVYPASIAAQVSPARLARFFDADAGSYRAKKAIREMIVFAKHNLISDSPFTRLDVLTCRNVLIYLELDLQRRLLPSFAYALAPKGLLLLGASETVTGIDGSFAPIDGATHKLYERREGTARASTELDLPRLTQASALSSTPSPGTAGRRSPLPESVTRAIVEHVTSPVIVVDAKGELLFASQRMGRYFEQPTGRSSVNVFAMAREGLAVPLRSALAKALARRTKVLERDVRILNSGRTHRFDLLVWPLEDDFAGSALVAFVEGVTPDDAKRPSSKPLDVAGLRELRRTKAQLEKVTREMGVSHELLRGMNEDLQSANEELQSANEELTTSKEEMQSMNEELRSLNSELQSTNERLVTTNDDMRNLLNSSQIPTLFLDNELRLKRFTAPALRIARLIATDVGRPITDLTWEIGYATLVEDVAEVLRSLVFKEAEVTARDGSVFTMRIHPYRTVDDLIDGVVMTFIDISAQKTAVARETAIARRSLLERVVDKWPGIAFVEDVESGRVDIVSAAVERLLGTTAQLSRRRSTINRRIELQHVDGARAAYRERVLILSEDAAGQPSALLHIFRRLRKRVPS